MKKLTRKAKEFIYQAVDGIFSRSGIKDARLCEPEENPFMYFIASPVANSERLVMEASNELFHALGLLPKGRHLALDEYNDYCYVIRTGQSFVTAFNHPAVFQFKETDPECRFILKNWNPGDYNDGDDDEARKSEKVCLINGIKSGRLKSKSPDGYLVLQAQYYDAIEKGTKKSNIATSRNISSSAQSALRRSALAAARSRTRRRCGGRSRRSCC